MEKYSSLPDIDHNTKDTFESSDIESDHEVRIPSSSAVPVDVSLGDSELVETPFQAGTRFSNETVKGHADFSGSIVNRVVGTKGYRVSSVAETVEQRLARIARELEEIGLEDEHIEKQRAGLVDIAEQLSSRHNRWKNYYSARVDSVFERDNSKSKEGSKDHSNEGSKDHSKEGSKESTEEAKENQAKDQDIQESPEQSEKSESKGSDGSDGSSESPISFSPSLMDTSMVLDLEARINNVETLLGHEPLGSSVSTEVRDLKRKISILHHPEYPLARIKEEILRLNTEMERTQSNRRFMEVAQDVSPSSRDDAKIEALYSHLAAFDETNAMVPWLVTRLKSLHTVHSDLARCVEVAGGLDEVLREMEDEVKRWEGSVHRLHEVLGEYEKEFERNRGEVGERLRILESAAK